MNYSATAWAQEPSHTRRRPIAEIFLGLEILFQLALLVHSLNIGLLRVVWRTGIFAFSIALIFFLRGKTRSTPTAVTAFWIMVLMTFEIFNPTSNTWLSAVAECCMYLAVLGPLFWMSRLNLDLRSFRRIILMFWGYYSISSLIGILQVYYPGRFEPQLSPMIASMGDAVAGLKIVLANGQTVFRPMGLTDMPGGAASAGLWAVLFGLGFLLTAPGGRHRILRRGAYLASMMAGMVCIYLSQARVMLVIVVVWFGTLLALLFWRRRWRQFRLMVALTVAIAMGGLAMAVRIGGVSALNRITTLTRSSSSGQLYSNERGVFFEQTVHDLIPAYPLGAGLGRWGMMNTYFGDNSDPRRGLIYVEIQFQGWVLDGGVPLLAGYLSLIGIAIVGLWRVARRRGPLWVWAAICVAYDISMIAFSFDYTPFTGDMGVEFWFINALILTTAACMDRMPARFIPPTWQ